METVYDNRDGSSGSQGGGQWQGRVVVFGTDEQSRGVLATFHSSFRVLRAALTRPHWVTHLDRRRAEPV